MAVQYAGGTNVNTTIAADDRTTLVDNLKAELLNAGWTSASGSSGDWKLDSATTPEGHNMRVRLLDPGSGNCAQIFIMNQAETLAPTQCAYLLPAASKTFIVIANRYQCFVYTAITTAAREFAAFGVLCVPSFYTIANASWMGGNATTDVDTGAGNNFRNKLYSEEMCAAIIGTNQWSGTAVSNGAVNLTAHISGAGATDRGYRWYDDSGQVYDAIISCGVAASSGEGKLIGQLWDAFVCSLAFTGDVYVNYDSKQFRAVTDNNTGTQARGTLFIYAP